MNDPGSADDIAEQLAAQVEQWFANLAKRGEIPRAFTGVTPDGRQLIVILNGLPFDHVKRRDFLIWLCQKYRMIAYAYATHVGKMLEHGTVEGLDIYASSYTKDVFISLSLDRHVDGSIHYARDFYLSEPAKVQKNQIFAGLHRSFQSSNLASREEFEKVWANLESKVQWRQTGRPSAQ